MSVRAISTLEPCAAHRRGVEPSPALALTSARDATSPRTARRSPALTAFTSGPSPLAPATDTRTAAAIRDTADAFRTRDITRLSIPTAPTQSPNRASEGLRSAKILSVILPHYQRLRGSSTPTWARTVDGRAGPEGPAPQSRLEAQPHRHLERAPAVDPGDRPRVVGVGAGGAEVARLDVSGPEAIGVERAGRVWSHGGVPGDQLVVVENVVELELDPGAHGAPDRDVVRDRQVHQTVSLERLRSALIEIQRLGSAAGQSGVAGIAGDLGCAQGYCGGEQGVGLRRVVAPDRPDGHVACWTQALVVHRPDPEFTALEVVERAVGKASRGQNLRPVAEVRRVGRLVRRFALEVAFVLELQRVVAAHVGAASHIVAADELHALVAALDVVAVPELEAIEGPEVDAVANHADLASGRRIIDEVLDEIRRVPPRIQHTAVALPELPPRRQGDFLGERRLETRGQEDVRGREIAADHRAVIRQVHPRGEIDSLACGSRVFGGDQTWRSDVGVPGVLHVAVLPRVVRVGGLERHRAAAGRVVGHAEARNDAVRVGADDVSGRFTVRLLDAHAEVERQAIGRRPVILQIERQRRDVHRGADGGQPVLNARGAWHEKRNDPALRIER